MKYVVSAFLRKPMRAGKGVKVPEVKSEGAWVFEEFDSAVAKLRELVAMMVKTSDFFPVEDGKYQPLAEFCDEVGYEDAAAQVIVLDALKDILNGRVCSVELPEDAFGWEETSFVYGADRIYVELCENVLDCNIGNMEDPEKTYYFTYEHFSDSVTVAYAVYVTLQKCE